MNTLVQNLTSLQEVPTQYRVNPTSDQLAVLDRMKNGLSDTMEGTQYLPGGFPPNQYQTNFYEHLIGTRYNLGLDAKAGTGKTSTIEAAVRLLRVVRGKSVLFLAFNRSIASELKERFAKKGYCVDVATVHSKGYQAVKFALKQKAHKSGFSATQIKEMELLETDGSYFRQYVRTNLQTQFTDEDGQPKFNYDELEEKFFQLEEFDAYQYVSTIVRLGDLGRMFFNAKEDNLYKLADDYALELQADEVQQAAKYVKEYTLEFFNYKPGKDEARIIDFTDMIWLPNVGSIMEKWTFKTYDYVFVDEAQDLSNTQRMLVQKFVKPSSGRLIFVGDPNQAIYGFAGADSKSFNKLTQLPNVKVLPLNLCYRCGSDIIKEAKAFVPGIEAHESTGKGSVQKGRIDQIKKGDLIIGRLTSPLVSLCMFLIRNRIQATVLGSNIGEGLISAIRGTRKRKVDEVLDKLWKKYDKAAERLVAMNKADNVEDAMNHPSISALNDKIETISVIAEQANVVTTKALINEINRIFSEDKAAVTLMTAHRSKGLEADNVFILDWEEHFPHKSAKTPDQIQQERNLQYVAITRAKKKLTFIYTPEYWDGIKAPKI